MGNRPSSVFGFGVAISQGLSELKEEPGSPLSIYSSGEPVGGIDIIGCGWVDEPILLVMIHESVSYSPDWSPKRIDDEKATRSAAWIGAIASFMDRWKLTPMEGFDVPGFIHAPQYG